MSKVRFSFLKSLSLLAMLLLGSTLQAATFYVAPDGDDKNPGTQAKPFATLPRAQTAARAVAGKEAVTVYLRAGTFYLSQPLSFASVDSGTAAAPVIYQAASGEQPVISGGVKLTLNWEPWRDGILKARVPADFKTEEIFINGDRQILARYPNFDPTAKYFDGFAADAISNERAARWANPAGGYFHAMHPALWGDFTWIITGKDASGAVLKEGGWQNNRGGAVHDKIRFVENIFEELDAPGEWFLDSKSSTLYFYPPAGVDLAKSTFEATRLRSLVEFTGDEKKPVCFVSLKGLTFRHAARTVMDTKESLLRTDWAIYRGGAIFFNGAEDCALEDSLLDQLGGNAVFVNNYNRRITIRGCEIRKAGASGICFVGDQKAVRDPLYNYNQSKPLAELDRTPGPLTNNYPADSLVEDCLIYLTGRVEKQTAGVEIDIAQGITVRHCSIYDMPRSGINIGDGCFGGHIVEFCDVFDTVKETGDHGSYNSWGRDRFWVPRISEIEKRVAEFPGLPLLDVVKPITLRNNRWRCDHGWDIDLDDGSTNYVITNNLCLNGGIKNREGYYRTVENNIMLNNTFHPHVWPANTQDIFRRNIIYSPYRPAGTIAKPWGKEMDYNIMHQQGATSTPPATALQKLSGRDEHSVLVEVQYIDPEKGDFRVKDGSPALELGFKNFPMDQFGVQKPSLKAIARTPSYTKGIVEVPRRDGRVQNWLGARVRNIMGQGEMSAYGTPGETGVLVLEVAPGSVLETGGLKKDDVILKLQGKPTEQFSNFAPIIAGIKEGAQLRITILRTQKESELALPMPLMPLSSPLVKQGEQGTLTLRATDSEITGRTARKQGQDIGNWKDPADIVRWQAQVDRPGTFIARIEYSLSPNSDGSVIDFTVADYTNTMQLPVTKDWNDYVVTEIGLITIKEPGTFIFKIRPSQKPGEAVMNLRAVTLAPK